MANQWSAPRKLASVADVIASLVGLESFFSNGGLPAYRQPRSVAAGTTLLASDRLLLVDTTAAGRTVTLPSASQFLPQPYAVKLIAGANNVTLDADGTELIYTSSGAGTLAWNTTGMTKWIVPCLVTSPGTWGWVVVASS